MSAGRPAPFIGITGPVRHLTLIQFGTVVPMARHSPSKPDPSPRTVSLPVVEAKVSGAGRRAPKMGATRMGRWRTGVLVFVHLVIAAHIIQWAVMGMTVSPVEPSESMQTLEMGVINAGAILFALAILSTLIFGRFFCGWLCHVVALQDACAWMMNKIGVRPKPFRSRLLVFAPLLLGFYMFIWPNFKRFAVAPLLEAASVPWPDWLKPVAPENMWRSEMIVSDFWATFPDWYIAVPFLLVCGFATVYFLGAKGFCTYACPYGGIFSPVDRLAPARIRVTDACTHCGTCTAVCTSNVRVSDEVWDYGMVVDPGCMKCMDCVAACPSDALYFGFGAPAVAKKVRDAEHHKQSKAKAKRRFDLTWPEEIAAALIFLVVFLAMRGVLDQIPMLLAGGVAIIVTFLVMTAWWTLARPHARVYGMVLKQKGRVRPLGLAFVAATLGVVVVVAWAAQARYPRWRADIAYAGAVIPAGMVMRPEFVPGAEARARAERAVGWLARADAFDRGGTGWNLNAEHRTRYAYFLAVLGRFGDAADQLAMVVEHGQPGDALVVQLARLRQASGAAEDDVQRIYEDALSRHPNLHGIRSELALRAAMRADPEAGAAYWQADDPEIREDVAFRLAESSYWARVGEPGRALEVLDLGVELAKADKHHASGWLADCAGVAMRLGQADQAQHLIDQALEAPGVHPGVWFAGAEIAATFGDPDLSVERIERGLAMPGGDTPASLSRAGGLMLRLRRLEQGAGLYQRAADGSRQPFEKSQLGHAMTRAGEGLGFAALTQAGFDAMTEAAGESREPILWHDLALARYEAGRGEKACDAIIRAAELAPDSVELARRAGEMCALLGDTQRAGVWNARAERRGDRDRGGSTD